MIKDFKNFVKESVENKGKGPGNIDLIPTTPKKQTLNNSNQTLDFLRIGKHILTKKIDGFIDSVQNERVYISDRITGEIKKYTFKEILKEITGNKIDEIPLKGFTGTPEWAKKPIVKEGLEQKKIQAVHTIENPEDEITDEYSDKIDNDVDEDIDDERINIDDVYENFKDDDEELVGDTYNPGMEPEYKEKEDWDEGEEEDYQEEDNDILRGTEDNPMGLNKGNKREMPNESWIKYWENFNKQQMGLIDEEEEDFEDYINDEELETEDEIEQVVGSEDNPIEARKRLKIEEYSEENPEPLPNDVVLQDDRYEQFDK